MILERFAGEISALWMKNDQKMINKSILQIKFN